MKKILASLLITVVLINSFAWNGNVYAKECTACEVVSGHRSFILEEMKTEAFLGLIMAYIDDESSHECSKEELYNSYLGELFKIPVINTDGELIWNDIYYCPLVRDGEVLAIVDFIINDERICYSISEAYVDTINEHSGKEVYMFFYNNELYCLEMNEDLFENEMLDKIDFNELTSVNFNGYVLMDNSSIYQILSGQVSVCGIGTVVDEKYLTNYPIIYQADSSTCWAGTIASMVAYEFPGEYYDINIMDVCAAVNWYKGADWQIMIQAMRYYFKNPYVPTYLERPLTMNEVSSIISNDDPIFMESLGYNSEGKIFSHATAVI